MTLELLTLLFITFCLLVGAVFIMIGAIGLLRFSDPMARLHAPTKVGTMGVGALLLASIIHSYVFGEGFSIHEVLIMAFLFVTAPISANFMAKVSLHRRTCETPPKPTMDTTWSTLDTPESDLDIGAGQEK
ncbi:MAG: Na+/H+ antiporter subunit G [Rhizobiaceae bacterium]